MAPHAILLIEQMKDPEAAAQVNEALRDVPSVTDVKVDLNQNAVTVWFTDVQEVNEEAVIAALDSAGYVVDRFEMGEPPAEQATP